MNFDRISLEKPKEIPTFVEYREILRDSNSLVTDLASGLVRDYGLDATPDREGGSEANTLAKYLVDFDLKLEDLKGKDILDLGSGKGYLKSALEKTGIGFRSCVSFDEGRIYGLQAADVGGKAEALPFADGTFDIVFAEHSAPVMTVLVSKRIDLVPVILEEMVRVLRAKGAAKINPVASSYVGQTPESEQASAQMKKAVLSETLRLHDKNSDFKVALTRVIQKSPRAGVRSIGLHGDEHHYLTIDKP